jgi:hypothetical protein
LELQQKTLGTDHVETWTSVDRLRLVLRRQGKNLEADEIPRRTSKGHHHEGDKTQLEVPLDPGRKPVQENDAGYSSEEQENPNKTSKNGVNILTKDVPIDVPDR